jgi:SH3-like domain-containing protein
MNAATKRPATLTALLALCAFAALAAPARGPAVRTQSRTPAATAATPCDVSAYVIDHDPKGLNVRSGPASTFKVVGNLPNEGVEGVLVHITGASGEWVRIDRATEQGGDEDRTLFKGEGWVYGPLLGTDGIGGIEGGTPVRDAPSKKGRVLIRMGVDTGGAVVRGCRGKWMYLEHKKVKGWAEGDTLCDNSLTNCS